MASILSPKIFKFILSILLTFFTITFLFEKNNTTVPTFANIEMNSIISGSIAILLIILIPFDNILKNRQFSVAPTDGYSRKTLLLKSLLFFKDIYSFAVS